MPHPAPATGSTACRTLQPAFCHCRALPPRLDCGRTQAIASDHFAATSLTGTAGDQSDTIGGRIARAREAANLTVAQAARRLGVKTATWQGWENDRAEPRSNKLMMMAGTFGVSPTWLLGGYGDGPTEAVEDEVQILRQELKSVAQDVAAAQTRLNAVLERLETFHTYHHVEPS